ncbi:MAG: YbhN family protein [Coprococcus sp.]
MEKKNKKKIVINAVVFIAIFLLTIYGVFKGENIGDIKEAVQNCNYYWLIPAILCIFIFIWCESVIIWFLMRSYGVRLKKRECFLYSSVGFFFSSVTPSATGGQPMQIYFMKKKKIPIPISTVILMIVTITYKLVLVVIGIGILIFARDFIAHYMGDIMFVFYLGLMLNVICIALLIMLVFHQTLAQKFAVFGMKLLEKTHLVKKRKHRIDKLIDSMDLYRDTAAYIKQHMGRMTLIFLFTFFQRCMLFAVTWFVYKAFELTGTSFITVIMLQAVISVSVDMLPLPGGMGVSESLFLKLFLPVFGESLLLPGLVLSRGIGYYTQLIISAIFTMIAAAIILFNDKKQVKDKRDEESK